MAETKLGRGARGPYQELAVVQHVARAVTVAIPVLAALRLSRKAKRTSTRIGWRERLLSLLACALLVAFVPLLALWPHGTWYPHAVMSYPEISALLGTWLIAGLLGIVGHVLACRRGPAIDA